LKRHNDHFVMSHVFDESAFDPETVHCETQGKRKPQRVLFDVI